MEIRLLLIQGLVWDFRLLKWSLYYEAKRSQQQINLTARPMQVNSSHHQTPKLLFHPRYH